MNVVSQAIKYRKGGGDLQEAVDIALGRRPVPKQTAPLSEGEQQHSQTQVWLVPDEDKVNRAILNAKKYLPNVKTAISPSNTTAGGYEVTFTGTYKENDIASILSDLGGVFRVDNSSGMDLGK